MLCFFFRTKTGKTGRCVVPVPDHLQLLGDTARKPIQPGQVILYIQHVLRDHKTFLFEGERIAKVARRYDIKYSHTVGTAPCYYLSPGPYMQWVIIDIQVGFANQRIPLIMQAGFEISLPTLGNRVVFIIDVIHPVIVGAQL